MKPLEEQIEALIAEKKASTQNLLKDKVNQLSLVDDVISNIEKSAKIAREKYDTLEFIVDDTASISKDDAVTSKDDSVAISKDDVINVEEVIFEKTQNKIIETPSNYLSKGDLVEQLRIARTAHKKWIANVQVFTRTGNLEEVKSLAPVNFTACDFGKWYYGKGQMLSSFVAYKDIEKPHQMVHDVYLRLLNLYDGGIVDTFLSSYKKQLRIRENQSDLLVKMLNDHSNMLFKNMDALEDTVKNLSNDQIKELNIV